VTASRSSSLLTVVPDGRWEPSPRLPEKGEPAESAVPVFEIGTEVECIKAWRSAGGSIVHRWGARFMVTFQNEVGVYLDDDGPFDPRRFAAAATEGEPADG
jgi:hypothetical protein